MKNIVLIKEIDLGPAAFEKDKEVNKLFDGPYRTLIEVRLQNGAILSRHKAAEPITVLCLSGKGIFRTGNDSQGLQAGILITLEGGVEHEVVAEPALHILVTKIKDS